MIFPSKANDPPVLAWILAGASDPWRIHMTAVSTASTMVHHPTSSRLWLAPSSEVAAIEAALPRYIRRQVAVQGIETPFNETRLASRYIKVRLSSLVEAERFVFLDSDILLVRPLPWKNWRFDGLAASRNRDADPGFMEEPTNRHAQSLFAAAGWDWRLLDGRPYFNTGLIVFGGDQATRDFAARWVGYWDDYRERTGQHYDQPSFNWAAAQLGTVTLLPDGFNAPVAVLPQAAAGASVFHYYSSYREEWRAPHTLMGKFVVQSASTGAIDFRGLRRALKRALPLVDRGASVLEYQLAGQQPLLAPHHFEQRPSAWRQQWDKQFSRFQHSVAKRYRKYQNSVTKRYRKWFAP